MNQNAMKKSSTIKIKNTYTGKLPRNVGFSKTDGVKMSNEDYYEELRKNGFEVEVTDKGILISRK